MPIHVLATPPCEDLGNVRTEHGSMSESGMRVRVSGVRVSMRVSGVRMSMRVSGVRVSTRVSGVRVSIRVSGVRVSMRVSGVRMSIRVSGVRVRIRVSGVRVSMRVRVSGVRVVQQTLELLMRRRWRWSIDYYTSSKIYILCFIDNTIFETLFENRPFNAMMETTLKSLKYHLYNSNIKKVRVKSTMARGPQRRIYYHC